MYEPETILELSRIWREHCPKLRFCQFILNEMAMYEQEHDIEDCFYVEDKSFVAFIKNRHEGDNK